MHIYWFIREWVVWLFELYFALLNIKTKAENKLDWNPIWSVLYFLIFFKDEHKVNPTQDNYIKTSIYMPLAELRQKRESNSKACVSESDALQPSYPQVLKCALLLHPSHWWHLVVINKFRLFWVVKGGSGFVCS